jgi:hypothetical protein
MPIHAGRQNVSFRANAENLENSTVFIEFWTSETISNPIQRRKRLVDRFKLLKTVWVLLWRKRGKQNIARPEEPTPQMMLDKQAKPTIGWQWRLRHSFRRPQ